MEIAPPDGRQEGKCMSIPALLQKGCGVVLIRLSGLEEMLGVVVDIL